MAPALGRGVFRDSSLGWALHRVRAWGMMLALAGCATAPQPIQYGQIDSFDLHYRSSFRVQDEWEKRGGAGKVRCFFDYEPREMWVSWGNESCIPHELAHAMGLNEDEARGMVGR